MSDHLLLLLILWPILAVALWAGWKTYRIARVTLLMKRYDTKNMDRTPPSRRRVAPPSTPPH